MPLVRNPSVIVVNLQRNVIQTDGSLNTAVFFQWWKSLSAVSFLLRLIMSLFLFYKIQKQQMGSLQRSCQGRRSEVKDMIIIFKKSSVREIDSRRRSRQGALSGRNAGVICFWAAEAAHRQANLWLRLGIDGGLHDDQNLNIQSFIGSDTLINPSLQRERYHFYFYFPLLASISSFTAQRLQHVCPLPHPPDPRSLPAL